MLFLGLCLIGRTRQQVSGHYTYLSIQPNGADVAGLIDFVLSRYGHHKSVIGVNVGSPFVFDWCYII
jgi:hypothetical protein